MSQLLPNELFALECLERYAESGDIVDKTNGQFAHCPTPEFLGGTKGYYLLEEDHMAQGLIQANDFESQTFFGHFNQKWLIEGDFPHYDWFLLWDYYDKYVSHLRKGKSSFKDPDTGEVQLLTKEEANEKGWVGFNTGRTTYRNPESGEYASLTKEEAEKRGWVPHLLGIKRVKKTCPQCGFEGSEPGLTRWHFDNCVEREGSWRWFVKSLELSSK